MLGTINGNTLTVKAFADVPQQSNRTSLFYSRRVAKHIIKLARKSGLDFLGTIHSHPASWDGSLSETDIYSALTEGERVAGICAIYLTKTKKKRCRLLFWQPQKPLTLHITK